MAGRVRRRDGALELTKALAENRVLTSVKLAYNAAISDKAKDALLVAAEQRAPPLSLELTK